MNNYKDRLREWNTSWNDIPRRLLWIIIMFGCMLLGLLVFPYVAPFVVAALFAWMIEPAVHFITKRLGDSKPIRVIVVAVFVLVVVGGVTMLVLYLSGVVVEQVKSLALVLPGWATIGTQNVRDWIEGLDLSVVLDPTLGVEAALMQLLAELSTMLSTLATRAASEAARIAFATVSKLPQGILFLIMTIVGTFYMSTDKKRIISFLKGLFPEKYQERSLLVRNSFLRAIFSQFRAAMVMLVITFVEILIGFTIMGFDYAILLALLLAVLDALPVIGAGLFLLPMIGYGLVIQDMGLAIGSGLIYIIIIFSRELVLPRIIGKQLGIYPLATMMAMYAGLHAMGFLGVIFGPLMLVLCKVALPTNLAVETLPEKKPLREWKKKKERQQNKR